MEKSMSVSASGQTLTDTNYVNNTFTLVKCLSSEDLCAIQTLIKPRKPPERQIFL